MRRTPDEQVTEPVTQVLQKKAPFINSVRVFRDKVYTSRTLILPSGACLAVAQHNASAVDEEQYQYLNSHPDFERLTE